MKTTATLTLLALMALTLDGTNACICLFHLLQEPVNITEFKNQLCKADFAGKVDVIASVVGQGEYGDIEDYYYEIKVDTKASNKEYVDADLASVKYAYRTDPPTQPSLSCEGAKMNVSESYFLTAGMHSSEKKSIQYIVCQSTMLWDDFVANYPEYYAEYKMGSKDNC